MDRSEKQKEINAMVAIADARNEERGRKILGWLRIDPDDPDQLTAYDRETGAILGPGIQCGHRYTIKYSKPMILPINILVQGQSESEPVLIHVAQITGTLHESAIKLTDVELTVLKHDDYSYQQSWKADQSLFRFALGDQIQEERTDRLAHDALGNPIAEFKPPDIAVFPGVITTCNEKLLKWLSRRPHDIDRVKSRLFEEIVAELLGSFGFEVELTAPARDGGFDLFACKLDELGIETTYIIECKHYLRQKVGVQPVRALYAVKQEHAVGHAIMVTNYYFTGSAWAFAESPHILNLHLKDREALLEWLRSYKHLKKMG